MGLNDQWMQRDLKVLWHPCTQMKDHEQLPLIPIRRGEGVWLEDFEGKRYLDAVSSWWVNVFGHANPRINQRIKDQVDQLEHVILAGFSHQPVIELSERLVAMTPAGLDRVFYADNGSSCIEVALKMSFHYWQNVGKPGKKRFVTLTNSYHGETIAAMSVGDVPLFTETYKALLLDTLKVPSPDCYLRPEGTSWEEHSRTMFQAMEQTLAEHHASISAVIVEPLAGSAGVLPPPKGYLKRLREICTQHNILLIFDEVITGFGRMGAMTGSEAFGVTPDLMCIAKQVTNGAIPMGAVIANSEIYQTFMNQPTPEYAVEFPHGYTYSAHPVACAAGIAALDLLQKENLVQAAAELAPHFEKLLHGVKGTKNIVDIRNYGLAGAIQIAARDGDAIVRPYEAAMKLWKAGFYVRFGGDTLQFGPTFNTTPQELDRLFDAVGETLNLID